MIFPDDDDDFDGPWAEELAGEWDNVEQRPMSDDEWDELMRDPLEDEQ